jgi:polar amino acid transport system substrate-binding protein
MNKIKLCFLIALIFLTSAAFWYTSKNTHHENDSLETIIVGTNAEFEPFSFKKDNEVVGFDIDVITEVLKRLNRKMVLKDMPFDALIPELQLGTVHVIAGGITPTKERAKRTLFTKPHLDGDYLAIITLKNGPDIHSLADLYGKKVIVNEGYTADAFMTTQQGPLVTSLSSSAISDGILALQNGRADAYITALRPLAPYFTTFGKDNFVITPIPGTEETSAFAISKYFPELRDYIQIMLDRMEEDGTLTALKEKWNLL